jgi:predicted nuclease of predicted toxin-antitoxin system
MKLLFDQNISFRITKLLSANFEGSTTVKSENLMDKNDLEIWHFARLNDFIIVSQDNDFNDILNLRGAPPKLIWLRMGNCSTSDIAEILESIYAELSDFTHNSGLNCFEIHKAH